MDAQDLTFGLKAGYFQTRFLLVGFLDVILSIWFLGLWVFILWVHLCCLGFFFIIEHLAGYFGYVIFDITSVSPACFLDSLELENDVSRLL